MQRTHRFSIAPMMEWTDRHCRFFHRLLTRRALLYTEMITTGAVLRGNRARLLGFDPAEHPAAVRVPVTVKCRIGIDEQDPEESLDTLTRIVVAAGVDALIVHARKAWLDGLSPRENRDIPPLDYDRVYRLERAWPSLHISINGGIASVEDAARHLAHLDGVMMGRAAYQE